MRTIRKRLSGLALAVLLGLNAQSVSAANSTYDYSHYEGEKPSFFEMGADLVVRPMTLAVTAVGAALWLVALPMTLIAGNAGEAGEVLVLTPGRYTFYRPLGYMELDAPTEWEQTADDTGETRDSGY
jgi:hypothetical protein